MSGMFSSLVNKSCRSPIPLVKFAVDLTDLSLIALCSWVMKGCFVDFECRDLAVIGSDSCLEQQPAKEEPLCPQFQSSLSKS
jgi:hypothetical protein